MTPESVSLRDVYDIVSKVDDKLDGFIKETHEHRTKCAAEFGSLDKRVSIIEDRGARFWGAILAVATIVSAAIASLVDRLWN